MVKSGDIKSFYILNLSRKGNKPERANHFLEKQLLNKMQITIPTMMFGLLFSMRLAYTRYLLVEVEDDVVGEPAARSGIIGHF